MKMQTFPGVPRSVLLTLLISLGAAAQVAAQDTPVPAAPPVPLPGVPVPQTDTNPPQADDAEQEEPAAETTQNDNAPPPMPGETAAVSRSDGEILQALKVVSEAEISQAELAIEEASSEEVKNAAQQIIEEHSNTIEQIDVLLTKVGVSLTESPLSAELLERSEATTGDLEALSGTEFECTYLQQQADEQFALNTVDRQLLPFASSFSVRNFLSEAAPKFEQQAVAAREMHENLDSCG